MPATTRLPLRAVAALALTVGLALGCTPATPPAAVPGPTGGNAAPAAPTPTPRIATPSFQVAGRATYGKAAMANAPVVVYKLGTKEVLGKGRTDAKGAFAVKVEGVKAGMPLEVVAFEGGHVLASVAFAKPLDKAKASRQLSQAASIYGDVSLTLGSTLTVGTLANDLFGFGQLATKRDPGAIATSLTAVGDMFGSMVVKNEAGLVAAGAGNLVAAGGGNLVAAGAGNMVAAGAGNLVAAGAGNLVAAGAGNYAVQQAGLGAALALDFAPPSMIVSMQDNMTALKGKLGASLIQPGGGNLVAAGGGNLVAAGAGNMVAAGAGNIIAAGAGNYATLQADGVDLELILAIIMTSYTVENQAELETPVAQDVLDVIAEEMGYTGDGDAVLNLDETNELLTTFTQSFGLYDMIGQDASGVAIEALSGDTVATLTDLFSDLLAASDIQDVIQQATETINTVEEDDDPTSFAESVFQETITNDTTSGDTTSGDTTGGETTGGDTTGGDAGGDTGGDPPPGDDPTSGGDPPPGEDSPTDDGAEDAPPFGATVPINTTDGKLKPPTQPLTLGKPTPRR